MDPSLRERLLTRTRPHLGQVVVWGLVYVAIVKSYGGIPPLLGERSDVPVTVLSGLPDSVLGNPVVFGVLRNVLVVAGLAWVVGVLVPWSCGLTVLAFTGVVAMRYENSPAISHVFQLPNVVLLIHALWYTLHRREIAEAARKGRFWRSNVYPAWVPWLTVFCIATFHTFAGVNKLVTSGPGWANGESLQLWMSLMGREDSIVRGLVLGNRNLAIGLQVATLVVETGAILAILSRTLRVVIGVALLGLYAGIVEAFGFSFWYNALLVAAFLLPFDRLVESVTTEADRDEDEPDANRSATAEDEGEAAVS